MSDDSQTQIRRVREAVDGMYVKIEEAVDSILTVASWPKWVAYLSGTSDASSLPVARALQGQVFGGAIDQVEALAAEHSEFVADNCARQVATYAKWAAQRAEAVGAAAPRADTGPSGAPDAATARAVVVAIRAFDQGRAVELLEAGTREAVVSTATWLGGSAGGAVVLTGVMQSGTEDALALALCCAAAYAGVVTLPLRRGAVKRGARGQVDEIQRTVQARLEEELRDGLTATRAAVEGLVAPIEAAARAETARVSALLRELDEVEARLGALRERVTKFE